jgi:hypothetical protein
MKKFKKKLIEEIEATGMTDIDFDYDELIVKRNPEKLSKIKVCIPNQAFTILPGMKSDPVLTVFNHGWSIVLPALAEQGNFIKGMALTTLYPGVMFDGTHFMLPVTLSFEGCETTWSKAWKQIVSIAEKQWIVVTKSSKEKKHEYTMVDSYGNPEWPDIELKDWVRIAFKGKVIRTMEDLEASQYKQTY